MDKLEFIARQLAKAQTKKYENYAVNRIWNRLADQPAEFTRQPHVVRPSGRRDLYFPQFGVHVKVNQGFHKSKSMRMDFVKWWIS